MFEIKITKDGAVIGNEKVKKKTITRRCLRQDKSLTGWEEGKA